MSTAGGTFEAALSCIEFYAKYLSAAGFISLYD